MSEGTSTSGSGVGTVRLVAFDTPDPKASAAFWQELTSAGKFDEDDDGWTGVTTPDGWRLGFQPAPDLVKPEWPGQEHPQQVHVDLQVADVAAATQRAVSLGATLLAENERWNTLADPVGHTFDLCVAEDSPDVTVMGVTFDVPDAHAAAVFWSTVLGDPITYDADGMAMLGGRRALLFQQVEGYNAPRWPDPAYPQQLHLDLDTGGRTLDEAEAAVVAAGATRLAGGETGCRVFADPAGHPFCLLD